MFWWSWFVFVLGVAAAPQPQGPPSPTTTPNPSACALISRGASSVLAVNPSGEHAHIPHRTAPHRTAPQATPAFPAAMAFDCLRTVPNRPGPALQLIESLKAFSNWQSTLPWLKDPPESYPLPPVDIQGTLDRIAAKAAAGGYISEYDFQLDIYLGIAAAHDGHFAYIGDIFKAFLFRNDLASDMVSLSPDGVSLPKLYRLSSFQRNARIMPPAITEINGVNATEFILDLGAQMSFYQDADARWNSFFPTYADPNANNPLFISLVYLGPSLTFTYENGETQTAATRAILRSDADFDGIASGDDFYDRFCTPSPPFNPMQDPVPATRLARSRRRRSDGDREGDRHDHGSPGALRPRSPSLSDYPDPIVQNSDEGTTMGFFLDEPGLRDVAVLAISSFSEETAFNYLSVFQNTVEAFLDACRAANKTRLVIDLTANGGGQILAGFELFAQLFPGRDAFNANNMRLPDSLVSLSRVLSSLPLRDQQEAVAVSPLLANLSPLELRTPQGDEFTSVDQLLTPVTLRGDKFSAYMRQPDVAGFTLTGTGRRANPPASPFKAEDIVLLTDGTCGSTCTIFSYLMIFQENVKTVSVGGAPRAGAMQAVGGVEGSQVLRFSEIANASAAAILISAELEGGGAAGAARLDASELGTLARGYAARRAADPARSPGSVNFKNAFAPADARTPLQFADAPARCRFFYAPAALFAPAALWARAANATWRDPAALCAPGSRVPAPAPAPLDPAFQAASTAPDAPGAPADDQAPGAGAAGGSSSTATEAGGQSSAARAPGAPRWAAWLLAAALAASYL
ncbi:hypothetical protein GGS23DRAFT_605709 [Durotheca rogersii]|uniref:uncharacterized protein n=1 Tax=Durotheca rogersii TaxID=419775 RepID=UPI002220A604|nr:uncharacterized protein GGS23DRAFT_605709 [Durotheca rogersii]KAI5862424.1 hypothetical protein GGS23DRAFT_605709 [Durotheca rogersii]